MSWFSKKEKPGEGTMEFSYVIKNKETGEIKSRRFRVPTYTNIVVFHSNFLKNYLSEDFELIASLLHKYNGKDKDLDSFQKCNAPNTPII